MIRCLIKGVGIAAPGLAGWQNSRAVLNGSADFAATAETPYAPALLPPNERRRATASVRQAFRAAEDAINGGSCDAGKLASVFASSDADMAVLHRICAALATPQRVISPTDFHNSVHNAASGYWSIAVQSMAPTTTLSAYDASFTAGLIEAAALANQRGSDVLLVAYDTPAPQPLLNKRSLATSASVALVLHAARSDVPSAPGVALGSIDIESGGAMESHCANAALESIRRGNPALRALPLLELLAAGRAGQVVLRATGDALLTIGFAP